MFEAIINFTWELFCTLILIGIIIRFVLPDLYFAIIRLIVNYGTCDDDDEDEDGEDNEEWYIPFDEDEDDEDESFQENLEELEEDLAEKEDEIFDAEEVLEELIDERDGILGTIDDLYIGLGEEYKFRPYWRDGYFGDSGGI